MGAAEGNWAVELYEAARHLIGGHPQRDLVEKMAERNRQQGIPALTLEPAEAGWLSVSIFHPDQRKRVRIGRLLFTPETIEEGRSGER